MFCYVFCSVPVHENILYLYLIGYLSLFFNFCHGSSREFMELLLNDCPAIHSHPFYQINSLASRHEINAPTHLQKFAFRRCFGERIKPLEFEKKKQTLNALLKKKKKSSLERKR